MDNIKDGLNTATVRKLLTNNFKKPKTTIHPKAVEMMTNVLNTVIVECALRAGKQAFSEDSSEVTSDILQKILPQMLFDF